MRNEGTNDGWEGNTCPIPVLPVFSEGDSVLIKTKFEVLRVNELNQEIWSVLRFADGLVTVEELVRLASSACGEPPETLRAVVRDLFTLGVLRDSRRLFTTQMELTDNPMPFSVELSKDEIFRNEKENGWQPHGKKKILPKVLPSPWAERQSCRNFADAPLGLEVIARILRGTIERLPSAGALYPVRLSLIINRSDGDIAPGLYHYDSIGESLYFKKDASEEEIAYCLNSDNGVFNAPVVVVVSADFECQAKKYSNRGMRYTLLESGIALGRILDVAARFKIGGLVYGAYNDEALSQLLFEEKHDAVRTVMLVALGYAASEEAQSSTGLNRLYETISLRFVGRDKMIERVGLTNAWRLPGDLSFYQALAIYPTTSCECHRHARKQEVVSSGTGESDRIANTKAIIEGIERRSSSAVRVDLVSPANQIENRVNVYDYVHLTEDQVASIDTLKVFNEDEDIEWVRAAYIGTGEEVYVPIDLVFYPLCSNCLGRKLLCHTNSSGVASHTTLDGAVESAFLELVERHAVLSCWHRQIPPRRFIPGKVSKYVRNRFEYWKSEGYEMHILDLSTFGIPIAGVVIGSRKIFPSFSFGSAAANNWKFAVHKALHEAEVDMATFRAYAQSPIASTSVKTAGDHGTFHAYDKERTAFKFLSSGENEPRWIDNDIASHELSELMTVLKCLSIRLKSPDPIMTCRVLSSELLPMTFGLEEYRPKWSSAPRIPHFFD